MKRLFLGLIFIGSSFAMNNNDPKGKEPIEESAFEKAVCPICLDDIKDYSANPIAVEKRTFLTGAELFADGLATHVFHTACIEKQLREGVGIYGCPLCRKPLKKELEKKYLRHRQPEEILRLRDLPPSFIGDVSWPVPTRGRSWFAQRDEGASHGEAELDGIHAPFHSLGGRGSHMRLAPISLVRMPEGRAHDFVGWEFLRAERRRCVFSILSYVSFSSLMRLRLSLERNALFDIVQEAIVSRLQEVAGPLVPSSVSALRLYFGHPVLVDAQEDEDGPGCQIQ
jgi:hypothetical protein